MGAYAVLIALAVYLLHGKLLYGVLILFGGLIAKTLIAVARQRVEAEDEHTEDP